jgi:hypothetical protein
MLQANEPEVQPRSIEVDIAGDLGGKSSRWHQVMEHPLWRVHSWARNPMSGATRVVTSRFCVGAFDGVEPSTVGYEPFSIRHQSLRTTNNTS